MNRTTRKFVSFYIAMAFVMFIYAIYSYFSETDNWLRGFLIGILSLLGLAVTKIFGGK